MSWTFWPTGTNYCNLRLLQSFSNLTSLPMKELLKLHFYTKGSYSLSQAQTKTILEFVLTAFSSASASDFKLHISGSLWPKIIPQTRQKLTTTQVLWNPICLLLFNIVALSPLMIMTLPTTARSMPQIDYSIQQVLHTIIQCAVTLTTQVYMLLFQCWKPRQQIIQIAIIDILLQLWYCLFLKHGYMIQFMTRKSYLPTTVFVTKTDTPTGGGVMIAIWDTIPATAVNVSTTVASKSIEVASVNLIFCKPFTICYIYNPLCTFWQCPFTNQRQTYTLWTQHPS